MPETEISDDHLSLIGQVLRLVIAERREALERFEADQTQAQGHRETIH
jgi:hypothetical protein